MGTARYQKNMENPCFWMIFSTGSGSKMQQCGSAPRGPQPPSIILEGGSARARAQSTGAANPRRGWVPCLAHIVIYRPSGAPTPQGPTNDRIYGYRIAASYCQAWSIKSAPRGGFSALTSCTAVAEPPPLLSLWDHSRLHSWYVCGSGPRVTAVCTRTPTSEFWPQNRCLRPGALQKRCKGIVGARGPPGHRSWAPWVPYTTRGRPWAP